jgi:hypothetical protein
VKVIVWIILVLHAPDAFKRVLLVKANQVGVVDCIERETIHGSLCCICTYLSQQDGTVPFLCGDELQLSRTPTIVQQGNPPQRSILIVNAIVHLCLFDFISGPIDAYATKLTIFTPQ